jgi:hypothetical protein
MLPRRNITTDDGKGILVGNGFTRGTDAFRSGMN